MLRRIVLLICLVCAPLPARADDGAAARVEALHAALLATMKSAASHGYDDRRAALEGPVGESFDFAFMARVTSGAAWRDMDPATRDDVVDAFREFTLANYAARFDGYSGQSFETLSVTAKGAARAYVRTRLNRPKDDPVRLDYLLQRDGEAWRIVDIVQDGKLSELATRRAEFAPILRDAGPAGLVAVLASKTAQLASDAGGAPPAP